MGTTPSLLDLVFTNEPYIVRNISYLPGLGNYTHLKDTRILRYNTRFIDYDSMYATLEDINWGGIMNSMNTLDA